MGGVLGIKHGDLEFSVSFLVLYLTLMLTLEVKCTFTKKIELYYFKSGLTCSRHGLSEKSRYILFPSKVFSCFYLNKL